ERPDPAGGSTRRPGPRPPRARRAGRAGRHGPPHRPRAPGHPSSRRDTPARHPRALHGAAQRGPAPQPRGGSGNDHGPPSATLGSVAGPTKREAVVAVLQRAGRVLVVKRGPEAVLSGYWAPLSGRIEPGESQEQAVIREVREEVGL